MASVLFAFLHHTAAFALVACLAVEVAVLSRPLTQQAVRMLRGVDAAYGLSALLVLMMGGLRMSLFEKGAAYYMGSPAFWVKMALFAAAGLLSVKPTLRFLRWAKDGDLTRAEAERAGLRRLGLIQLGVLLGVLLAAAALGRGY